MSARELGATRRINRGRGHSYQLDGVECDGVTTLLRDGLAKPGLTAWAARTAAEFVAAHRDILTDLTDQELVELVKGAPFRERDSAAVAGTRVHELAARLLSAPPGTDVEIPTEFVGYVDSYLDFRRRWQPVGIAGGPELSEATVVNRARRYMGTLDWLGYIPRLGADTLIDYKTSKSGPFGETALQLAAYGNAESLLLEREALGPRGGRRVELYEMPMVRPTRYAVLWLTPDGYELIPFDVGEREFRTFLYIAEVSRWVRARCGSGNNTPASPVMGYALADPPLVEVVQGGK